MSCTIELCCARIPGVVGILADHYWFVIKQQNRIDRWEVWQHKNCCFLSWNYLHKNLLSAYSGVGSAESRISYVWDGDDALKIADIIENSIHSYPYKELYRYWPGPNSNTYVQWILKESGFETLLGFRAIGKGYIRYAS